MDRQATSHKLCLFLCWTNSFLQTHLKNICLPKENLKSRAGNGGFRGGQSAGAAAGTPRKSEGPTEFHWHFHADAPSLIHKAALSYESQWRWMAPPLPQQYRTRSAVQLQIKVDTIGPLDGPRHGGWFRRLCFPPKPPPAFWCIQINPGTNLSPPAVLPRR